MKYRSLMFVQDENGVELKNVGDIIPKFSNNISIGIDGSSTITGISYIDSNTSAILGTTACYREVDEHGKVCEDFVTYKVRLKQFIKKVIDENISIIPYIDYEEPFIGYAEASKVLMSIRTSVRELIVENEPHYNNFKYEEINNQKWKKMWLAPEKVPVGTDAQKAAAREKLIKCIPAMKICEQDEVDATCMEYIATQSRLKGTAEELKTKKSNKPFKYNIRFIGVEEKGHFGEQAMICELENSVKDFKVPTRVLENGLSIVDLNGHGLFEKHIFSNMGDDDKLLVLGFDNNKYVNAIIENNVSWMISNFEYLYAVVWRKSRK